ncbi:NAD-dependent epimerase [Porticoccaceae bacterium]|nr:NAD-dependent epimerase [Porticoccaceae bacterium]
MKVLVTGAAGFIGFHVAKYLCQRGDEVVGIDNLNDYYEVSLKEARLSQLEPLENFRFIKLDIADCGGMNKLFLAENFENVVHLAAQAGVRYSIENPHAYADSNLVGFLNILEGCRHAKVKHLVYASSSSVYGANETIPFSESNNIDHPVSLYAASKKANEAMAHSYSHLYNLPTTGLRFFTVYGPWGRPDMSPIIFARAIINGKPLKVFNYGKHRRDFTYIDDIVQGVVLTLDNVAQPDLDWSGLDPKPDSSKAPWRIYNIANSQPVELLYFIECLEKSLRKTTEKEMFPLQPGDIEHTYADISALIQDTGYQPNTSVETGIEKFSEWFLKYYTR